MDSHPSRSDVSHGCRILFPGVARKSQREIALNRPQVGAMRVRSEHVTAMRACRWAKFFLLRVVGASPRTQDHRNKRRKCAMQRFMKRIVVADTFVHVRGKYVQAVAKFF